jgi:hypothetical protein
MEQVPQSLDSLNPEVREKVHREADYILYSLETGGYNLPSLTRAMDVIRQTATGPLVDAAASEWDQWMADLRKLWSAVRAWNEATISPILESYNGKGIIPPEAIPDMGFAEFRETPEGARLFQAKEDALHIAHAPRVRLKSALQELVRATGNEQTDNYGESVPSIST